MARITVRLTPRAGHNAIDGWDGETLHVHVTAPPVDGKANDALLGLLAKALRVPPSSIALVSGARSRTKIVDIAGASDEKVRSALDRRA